MEEGRTSTFHPTFANGLVSNAVLYTAGIVSWNLGIRLNVQQEKVIEVIKKI